jgi:hypothetical protein
MHKMFAFAAVCLIATAAVSDTVTVTVSAAGADAYSAPINISGYLDRVEIYRTPDAASDVVNVDLATFIGTTAVETYVDLNAVATNAAPTVVRPRFLPTSAGGVALAAATTTYAGDATNGTNAVVTTVLSAPYEKPLVGGNLKLKVSAAAGTNATVTATLYYKRLPR